MSARISTCGHFWTEPASPSNCLPEVVPIAWAPSFETAQGPRVCWVFNLRYSTYSVARRSLLLFMFTVIHTSRLSARSFGRSWQFRCRSRNVHHLPGSRVEIAAVLCLHCSGFTDHRTSSHSVSLANKTHMSCAQTRHSPRGRSV